VTSIREEESWQLAEQSPGEGCTVQTHWGHGLINIENPYNVANSNVLIAVFDSGFDEQHPEFHGLTTLQYRFVPDEGNTRDICGHGMELAWHMH
jgi:hypothetical protein